MSGENAGTLESEKKKYQNQQLPPAADMRKQAIAQGKVQRKVRWQFKGLISFAAAACFASP